MSGMALVGGAVAGAIALSLVYVVLTLISQWKVFVKYGEPGWKGIIPFYSDYVQCCKVWNMKIAIAFLALEIVRMVAGTRVDSRIAAVIGIAVLVLNILICHKKSKAFGYGIGMTIVLALVPFAGNLIIGMGDAEYLGPQ